MKKPIVINKRDYFFDSDYVHEAIRRCMQIFDEDYKEYLARFKKETKDKTPKAIYAESLSVIKNQERLKTPDEIKQDMYVNCFVLGEKARYPYIPDASTVREYAREAAHITIQWEAQSKLKLGGKRKVAIRPLIIQAIGKYKEPQENRKAWTTKIIEHILTKKTGHPRDSIRKALSNYLGELHGVK